MGGGCGNLNEKKKQNKTKYGKVIITEDYPDSIAKISELNS